MGGDKKLVRTEQHLSTTLDGEEVILHRESDQYFGLNEVGTKLWALLEEPRTVDELVDELDNEFGVPETTCREDVEAFVDDLEEAELLRSVDAQDS